MTNIQKVREWIKGIRENEKEMRMLKGICYNKDFSDGFMLCLKQLLSFLDTLEEENLSIMPCNHEWEDHDTYETCKKCHVSQYKPKAEYHSKSEMRRVEHMKEAEKKTPPRKTIIKNMGKCKKCGDIIESKSVHDFVTCSCGAVSVDGGKDYLKRCGEFESFEEMSEVKAESK